MLRTAGPDGLRPVGHPRDPVQRPAGRSTALDDRRRHPEEPGLRQRRPRRRPVDRDRRRGTTPARRSSTGTCSLHRAANFYQANWARGHRRSPRTATSTRSTCPARPADDKPVLGGGEFVTAFADRPEVQALPGVPVQPGVGQRQGRAATGQGWLSANSGLDPENCCSRRSTSSSVDLLTDDSYSLPVRRLRPDARRRRRRRVLEADDRVDQRGPVRPGDPRQRSRRPGRRPDRLTVRRVGVAGTAAPTPASRARSTHDADLDDEEG